MPVTEIPPPGYSGIHSGIQVFRIQVFGFSGIHSGIQAFGYSGIWVKLNRLN